MKVIVRDEHRILLDDADYECLSFHTWTVVKLRGTYYAFRSVFLGNHRYQRIYLHREVLGLKPRGPRVDHEDHNGLNNQRCNLRVATASQNGANRIKGKPSATSRFKGVCLHKRSQRWQVAIQVNRETLYLGYHATEEEAAVAYNAAAQLYFGQFALLNDLSNPRQSE